MFLNCKLEIDNAKPKTKIIFEIFDPIILPMDKSVEFSKTAFKDTRSSDKEVPKPITINPMKKSETFNFFPIDIAVDNKISAPLITKKSPKKRVRNWLAILRLIKF